MINQIIPVQHALEFKTVNWWLCFPLPFGASFRISDLYRTQILKSIFSNLSGESLLDFGCGTKPYKGILQSEKIKSWIGVDLPSRTTGESTKNQADLFFESNRIPVKDESFELVLCTQVLEHVQDVELVLGEIARVTKKNGHVILTVPMTGVLHEEPYDFRRFTPYGISEMADKKGLKLKQCVALGGVITTITTLLAGHLNFLRSIPLLGGPIHWLSVGLVTQFGFWLELILFKLGFHQHQITSDFLFVLTRGDH